jgi:hypothetical protein
MILESIPIIGCAVNLYLSFIKPNASKDIEKANRVIADAHLNKMLAKTGATGDKTLSTTKRTKAMDAYIVGNVSYNVTDATITANRLASKNYLKIKDLALIVVALISTIMLIATFNPAYGMIIMTIGMVIYILKDIPRESAIYLLSSLSSLNIMLIIFGLGYSLAEYVGLQRDTKSLRALSYLIITCLILI